MLSNLLIYRLLIFNCLSVALMVWAYTKGYVTEILVEDTSRISIAIVALFLVGFWSIMVRSWKVSRALNEIKAGGAVDIDGIKFQAKGEHIDDISGWLVTLGLIGTVIGIVMALSAMDQNAMSTAEGVQHSIGTLVGGMKVAVYTTLVGAVFGLWIDVNRRILKTATVLMLRDAAK